MPRANMCSAGVDAECPTLSCTLYIDHAQTYADVAFGGTVGAGEAYIRGQWRCDDLTAWCASSSPIANA